jgi:hypothetical protein
VRTGQPVALCETRVIGGEGGAAARRGSEGDDGKRGAEPAWTDGSRTDLHIRIIAAGGGALVTVRLPCAGPGSQGASHARDKLQSLARAGVAQLVEHLLPKQKVAGSNPVSR